MGVIRQFWQEIISAVFTENRFIYICNTIICCWGTTNWGAFSTPFLFYKIVIFVIMKKNLIVVAIGVLVLGGVKSKYTADEIETIAKALANYKP